MGTGKRYVGIEVSEGDVSISVLEQQTGIRAEIWAMLARNQHLSCSTWVNESPELVDEAQARAIAARLTAARTAREGQGITAREAEAKYGFAHVSFYKWHKDGWIRTVGTGAYNAVLFDEGDIAMARVLADIQGQTAGRSVFPSKPRPGRPPRKR
jgi:hypothetical protein